MGNKQHNPWGRWAAVVVASAAGSLCQAQQHIVPLDPAAGDARGINAHGDVVFDNYILLNGTLSLLGNGLLVTDGGPAAFPSQMDRARAINDNGEAVGALQYHAAFRDSAGNISDLGVIAGVPLSESSAALGMNNVGTIVGTGKSVAIGAQWQGWYGTVGGPLIKLIPPASGNDGSAFDINDGGLITGYYNRFGATIYPESVAYIFNTHTSQWTEIGLGVGRAINESGEVAGTLAKSNCGHAFVHRNGVTTDIGTLGGSCSYALAINDHGNVAGYSLIAPNPEYRPFLFNGAMQDVIDLIPANDPYKTAAEITEATGINNDGVIVVNGLDKLNIAPNAPPIRRAWLLQVPQVYFEGGIQNFGEIPAGSTSATKIITLTNKGAANATLNFILMRGNFTQTNNCPGSLAPGASCVFNVAFNPPAGVAGSYTGGLTVSVNGTPFRTQATGQTPMPVTLSINPANVVAQTPFTLSWSAPVGATCWGTGTANLEDNESWSSGKAASGALSYRIPVAGAYTIGMQCSLNGAIGMAPNLQFTAALPTVTVALTPSATTVYAGQSFTLSWSSTAANECVPTGDDPAWVTAWRPANGSLVIAAPSSINVAVPFTYTLRCDNFANHVSATAQTVVTMNPGPPPAQQPPPVQQPPQSQTPPASSGGGGGSLDRGLLSGLLLALMAGMATRRRTPPRLPRSAS